MPGTQLSTHCLFAPAELGSVLPRTLWYRPHRRLAPAVLRALCRQLQAGRSAGTLGEVWKLMQHLPTPWSLSPCPGVGGTAAFVRRLVDRSERGAGASGRGDGAISPALADSLSLHLHSVQLPRIILEQTFGLATRRDSPPSHVRPRHLVAPAKDQGPR